MGTIPYLLSSLKTSAQSIEGFCSLHWKPWILAWVWSILKGLWSNCTRWSDQMLGGCHAACYLDVPMENITVSYLVCLLNICPQAFGTLADTGWGLVLDDWYEKPKSFTLISLPLFLFLLLIFIQRSNYHLATIIVIVFSAQPYPLPCIKEHWSLIQTASKFSRNTHLKLAFEHNSHVPQVTKTQTSICLVMIWPSEAYNTDYAEKAVYDKSFHF